MMENETWLDAKEALRLGFCDTILYTDDQDPEEEQEDNLDTERITNLFSTRQMDLAIMNKLGIERKVEPEKPLIGLDGKTKDGAMPYEILAKQLELLRGVQK